MHSRFGGGGAASGTCPSATAAGGSTVAPLLLLLVLLPPARCCVLQARRRRRCTLAKGVERPPPGLRLDRSWAEPRPETRRHRGCNMVSLLEGWEERMQGPLGFMAAARSAKGLINSSYNLLRRRGQDGLTRHC